MTLKERLHAKASLYTVAAREECNVAQIRNDIQAAIDEAWDTAWVQGNLQAQANWQRLFPHGKKPSVEEFIAVMANQIK